VNLTVAEAFNIVEEAESMSEAASRVLPVANLREFFRDSLQGALAKQHLAVEDQTEHYVVICSRCSRRSEALYERTPEVCA